MHNLQRTAKHFVRMHPVLFDASYRMRRTLGIKSRIYPVLDRFSKKVLSRRVYFVQIGAADGMRSDPIREFVVRDHWGGILVEPIPTAFENLKRNYAIYRRNNLTFVNAAVSGTTGPLEMFTFDESLLSTIDYEELCDIMQKSSVIEEHAAAFGIAANHRTALKLIQVAGLSFSDLVNAYAKDQMVDLIAIDAEGYENTIIPNLDLAKVDPTAILFESHNLGAGRPMVLQFLWRNNFATFSLGGDAIAISQKFLALHRDELIHALPVESQITAL